MKKSKPVFDLSTEVGCAIWEAFTSKTRSDLIKLLQKGQTPKQIESGMKKAIERKQPHLPAWKQKELAGRYYLATEYAIKNNLHLN